MTAFDQIPRFRSRPLEWLTSLGRGAEGMTERFLTQLRRQLDQADEDVNPLRLVSLRSEFRKVIYHDVTIPVLQKRFHNGGPLYRAVLVWLLSKHASRFQLLGIDTHCDDPSPLVRKHVAKALYRLEAWELLKQMARRHPDDAAVQRFVEPSSNRKSYDERLASFSDHISRERSPIYVGPSRMPLWFRDEFWSGAPPKSIEFMREILRRIQTMVHG